VLSERAGLAGSHVGLIEAGRRGKHSGLAWETARDLARALGVRPEWLMDGTGEPPTEDEIRAHIASETPESHAKAG
jgi:hypothetical protein